MAARLQTKYKLHNCTGTSFSAIHFVCICTVLRISFLTKLKAAACDKIKHPRQNLDKHQSSLILFFLSSPLFLGGGAFTIQEKEKNESETQIQPSSLTTFPILQTYNIHHIHITHLFLQNQILKREENRLIGLHQTGSQHNFFTQLNFLVQNFSIYNCFHKIFSI